MLEAALSDELERMHKRNVQLETDIADERVRSRMMEAALGSNGIGGPAERIKAQGFLKKKTPSLVVGRDYDRRWFIMTQTHLRYFEERGAISLDNQVAIGFVDKDPSAFSLHHPKMHRKFELRCETLTERDRWMALLSGNPVPSQEDIQIDLADIQKEEEAERELIESQSANRLQFFSWWMESEMQLVQQRIADHRKARDFAMQLLATDEKMENYRNEAADIEGDLHSQITTLKNSLATEITRKERCKANASQSTGESHSKTLLQTYSSKWLRWIIQRNKSTFRDEIAALTEEKLRIAGRLSEAQHNGERFMQAHQISKRVIVDLTSDVNMLEDKWLWLERSYNMLLEEKQQRFDMIVWHIFQSKLSKPIPLHQY